MEITVDNPWRALPLKEPFVLEIDREAVQRFNATKEDQLHPHRIHLELMPEPYLGDPINAAVILLNLNPGYSEKDHEFYSDALRKQACLDNLLHKSSPYPFFLLNPAYKCFSGPQWWRKKLNQLIFETSPEQVARSLCCIEYFPYHSGKFGAGKLALESQRYSFELVRKAIADQKIILIMRSRRLWEAAVPELKTCKPYSLRSPQGVWITRNNISDGGYDLIKERLLAHN